MEKQRILLTGGAGNIGSSLAEGLARNPNYQVVVVDNLITGSLSKIPQNYPNLQFIKADVNNWADISAIMLSYRFDYVFHYAALVGVKRTLENPLLVLEDIEGLKFVLQLCKNTGVKRVFFSSSSEVYGEPVEIPQHEHTTPLNSRLPYAIVKNLGEAFLRAYRQEHGLDFTIFRFFNTYGPRQSEDFVIARFIKQALRGEPLHVNGDGRQTRTFCYIDDNVEVTLKALKEGHFLNDVVNLGNDEEMTILDLAQRVLKITGSQSPIVHLPPLPEGDMTRRCPNIEKMKAVLQRPLTPLEEGIRKTANLG